tara:strand:- start:5731 stop:7500 length:1770 start_codon:yes stop_codon:yes gene_type:complete
MFKNLLNYFRIETQELNDIILNADKFILSVLWLHLPFVSFVATYPYGTWKEGLLASTMICLIGTVSYLTSRGTLGHRILSGLLLLSYSVVLITVQFGRIEMHFHVFGALPLLILYRDWRVLPPAALLIAFHHAAFNYCQINNIDMFGFPLVVFNYGNGWDIVLLHAFFVVFETTALIYYAETLRKQHLFVCNVNRNLESLVAERTQSLTQEKEKIEAYNKSLDLVAMTELTDANGIILSVNKNFEEVSGYTQEELVGKDHSILKSDYHPPIFFKNMWKKIKAGDVWRGEIKNLTKDGKEFWVETAIAPLKNSQGEISHFMAIRFDITNKKENEATILKQQEQIVSQAKLSSLGEMAGNIAHEINNPLTVINGTVFTMRRMIEKDMLNSDRFEEALEDITKTVSRITKIVSGLRNVSRDASSESLDICSIDDILDDVLPLCSEKLKNNDVDLQVIINENLKEREIHLNRVQMSQVLLNLISNSFDEIEAKQFPERWIKVEASFEANKLFLKVTDSGQGIPEDIQAKIFQPFFTTKDFGKGTGLGLSLCHNIIKRHNGQFKVDNTSPYTCFVIELPLKAEADLASETEKAI